MVQAPRFCTGCGQALQAGMAFCIRCGRPVRGPAAAAPAVPPYPTPGPASPALPAGGFLPAGTVLRSKYVVEKRLGSGGMGRVYLGRDRDLRVKTFALKEMNFEGMSASSLADAVERFYGEAETLAGLNHPGIPHVFERFEESSRYFMVMEFVEGQDLEKLLEIHEQVRGTPLPERAVARLALQICEALDYLHRRQPPIIHRDIKPPNAIVTPAGRVKLVDFGIARSTGRRHTQAGTVGYAPREQYDGATEPRSDLYSLGATMHHLVTGRLPVPFDFPPCRTLNPAVTPEFEALVAQMLTPALTDRPESARAVWKRLQQLYPDQSALGPGDPDALVEVVDVLRPSGLLPTPTVPQSPDLTVPPAVSAPLCPTCGKANRTTGKFCTGCGTPLPAPQQHP